jgi:hypothetical protein
VPSLVAYATVTAAELAAERETVKVALELPELPSLTETSLTDSAGAAVVKVASALAARLPAASRLSTRK